MVRRDIPIPKLRAHHTILLGPVHTEWLVGTVATGEAFLHLSSQQKKRLTNFQRSGCVGRAIRQQGSKREIAEQMGVSRNAVRESLKSFQVL